MYLASHVDGDDRVDSILFTCAVIFADTDQAVASPVRGEVRAQNYQDTIRDESRSLTSSVASIGVGYLL